MFSTMMTDESTMMPKSTAPIDSRLADLPRRNSTAKANSSASGMLMATIRALRTLLRNISRITVTSTMPTARFSRTVSVVTWIRSSPVVVRLDLHARQQLARRVVQLLDLLLDPGERRQRGLALAQQDDALDLVVLVAHDGLAVCIDHQPAPIVVLRPHDADLAEARLVADDDAGLAVIRILSHQVLDADRHVVDGGDDDFADLVNAVVLLLAQTVGGRGGLLHA